MSAGLECSIAICDGFNLLLPANQIVDIASGIDIPRARPADQPHWHLGELSWRGLSIPVFGIEQLVSGRTARIKGRDG